MTESSESKGRAIAHKAAGGAVWTIATSVLSRGLGLAGTLLITRYLAPDVLGEVSNAFILVITAHTFSTLGVTQYLVAKPDEPREVTWHVTLVSLVVGAFAIFGMGLFGGHFAGVLSSPSIQLYLPGFAVALYIERVSIIPERLLVRSMEFRTLGMWRTASEITYSVTSIALAIAGLGGFAIVIGNIARSVVYAFGVMRATTFAEWLKPAPLSGAIVRKLLEFGVPLSIGGSAGQMSRRWDNLLMSHLFGATTVGEYNLAYNLAEVPAVQIGYQIGDVLMPAFAKLDPPQRREALVRSTGLLALIIFPMALGLGAIAKSAVDSLLRSQWANVAPMLSVLCTLAIGSPIGWTIGAYLQTLGRTRVIMVLEVVKLVVLLGTMYVLARAAGPVAACGAAGVAFALHALASLWAVHRIDQVRFGAVVLGCLRPLVACVPMVAGVLAVRRMMPQPDVVPGVRMIVELAVGMLAYVASVFVVAGDAARELLRLVADVVRRRRGGGDRAEA